jgi:hypothetical protein
VYAEWLLEGEKIERDRSREVVGKPGELRK